MLLVKWFERLQMGGNNKMPPPIFFLLLLCMGVFPAGVLAQLPAPTGLTVTAGDQSLTVSWDDVAGTSLRHVDYTSSTSVGDTDLIRPAREGPAKGWIAAHPGSGPSSYTITGLTNGTTYRVRVRLWTTDLTDYAFGTGTPEQTLGPPTGLTLTSADPLVGVCTKNRI